MADLDGSTECDAVIMRYTAGVQYGIGSDLDVTNVSIIIV